MTNHETSDRVSVGLVDGRQIHLDQIFQYHTYSGLLEGQPDPELNGKLIARAVEYCSSRLFSPTRPFVVPPPRISLGSHNGKSEERIPYIACLGHFTSYAPARDPHHDGSSLSVVWFQEHYAPPIDAVTLDQLKAVNWRDLAEDWSF